MITKHFSSVIMIYFASITAVISQSELTPVDEWKNLNPDFSITSENMHDIVYGSEGFVAVGYDIIHSAEGISWNNEKSVTPELQCVGFGNGNYVALSKWEELEGNLLCNYIYGVAGLSGLSFAGRYQSYSYTSNDGTQFTSNQIGGDGCFANYSYGYYGSCDPEEYYFMAHIEYFDSAFFSGGVRVHNYGICNKELHASIFRSSDGQSWNYEEDMDGIPFSFAKSDTKIVGVGSGIETESDSGRIFVSSDGINWSEQRTSIPSLRDITYAEGKFVGVGDEGTIITSTNGTDWNVEDAPTQASLNGVAYGDSTFVAVGDSGTICVSNNGENWLLDESGISSYLTSVDYGNAAFVAVGANGSILHAYSNAPPYIIETYDTSMVEDSVLDMSLDIIDSFDADGDDLDLIILDSANYSISDTTIKPDTNFYGGIHVPVCVTDDQDTSDVAIVDINVISVNDPPSFTPGDDQDVSEATSQQTVFGWAKNISAGPDNENDQIMSFLVDTDQDSLFLIKPAIDSITGDLTYTPVYDKNGVATVSVVLKDDGGTENGGIDTSSVYSFTITLSGNTGFDNHLAEITNLKVYPNPTNNKTTIEYSLHSSSKVTLAMYNVIGEKFIEIVNEQQKPGKHRYHYNIKNAGIYYLKLTINGQKLTKKIVGLKQ